MKITIHPHKERRYHVEAQGFETECRPADIMQESVFAHAFLGQHDRFWKRMGQKAFVEAVSHALEHATKATPVTVERMVTANLWDFVHFHRDDNAASIHEGAAYWKGDVVLFKLASFESCLRARGITIPTSKLGSLLVDIGVERRGNTDIGGRQIRPYQVLIDVLTKRYRHGN